MIFRCVDDVGTPFLMQKSQNGVKSACKKSQNGVYLHYKKSQNGARFMKRKVYNKLLAWKKDEKGKCAILIDGARRVGKSYIVKEFAKNEYRSHIVIDFNNASVEIFELFENYISNLDTFFVLLQNLIGVKLYDRESLIVFDEVQLCPKARAAIKYLVEDGRYDYIETGSLVSINKNVKGIVIPSEERRIEMNPMDFEEFLWALDEEMLMLYISECYDKKKAMGPLHRKAMDLFRLYMIVGGMPQAVLKYVETKDFVKVDRVKRDILQLYKADIAKYAEGYESKVKSIFEQIPASLQRHEKVIKLSDLKKGARYRDYESSFFWLEESRVINICRGATEPTIGLRMSMDSMKLKCYMADTGLLISLAFDENEIKNEELYRKLLFDKLEINKGMLVENIVAQMLVASGHKLYFFSNYSDVASDRMEIDFLIAKQNLTSRHNISSIEVKSGKNYTLSSLTKFKDKYSQMLSMSYVIHSADLRKDEQCCYLPLYMTPML